MNVLSRARWRAWATPDRLLVALIWLALTGLAALFVRSGDDWAWGSAEGIERLRTGFADYNGRYVANLIVLGLTRAGWLTPVLVGAGLTALVVLCARVARVPGSVGYVVAAALVLAMPAGQWRQGVAWLSGFTNYTLGAVVALAAFAMMCGARRGPSGLRGVLLVGPFAVCAQLLLETVSCYLLLLSLCHLVLQWRRGRPDAVGWAWALGSVAGFVLMFSNARYWAAFTGTSDYQGLGDPSTGLGVAAVMRQAGGPISLLAAVEPVHLLASFSLVLLAIVISRGLGSRASWPWLVAALLVVAATCGAVVISSYRSVAADPGQWTTWSWVVALCLVAGLVTAGSRLDAERRVRFNLLVGSAVVLVMPLVAIRPYGPRNFVPSYAFLVAALLVLLSYLLEESGAEGPLRAVFLAAGVCAGVVALVAHAAVHAKIERAAHARLAVVRAAAADGQERVRVDRLPWSDRVHVGEPTPGLWERRYKAYYDVPDDLQIVLRPPS